MSFVELVESIAEKTGLPKTSVAAVLRAFQSEVIRVSSLGASIKLPGLGAFYGAKTKARHLFGGLREGRSRNILKFRESRSVMEKLGVVLDDAKTKTAGLCKTCPKCGTELTESEIESSKCPYCGTEPFEKKPEGE